MKSSIPGFFYLAKNFILPKRNTFFFKIVALVLSVLCSFYSFSFSWMTRVLFKASHMAQWVKNPATMQETQEMWVWSLGQEDPLEQCMATHSIILMWRIPWVEGPGGLMGSQRVGHDWSNWVHMSIIYASFYLLCWLINYSCLFC